MSLIERLEAKRRELDKAVVRSLTGSYDFRAAEMRDLFDEVLAMIKVPIMKAGDFLDLEKWNAPGYIILSDH